MTPLPFVGVDDPFVPEMSLRHNVAGTPRVRALHRLLDRRHPVKTILRPFLSSRWRLTLRERVRALNLRRRPRWAATCVATWSGSFGRTSWRSRTYSAAISRTG